MKTGRATLVLALLFLFQCTLQAQKKYSSVRIYPSEDRSRFDQLIGDLRIDHFYHDGEGVAVEISHDDITIVRSSGIKFKILVDDVYAEVKKQNEKFFADRAAGRVAIEQSDRVVENIIATPASFVVQGTFGGYYSFAQMEAAMTALATAYPSIVSKTSLGKSHENRDIWCIKISDNVAADDMSEPDILYMGLQHAREAITGSSMIFFMQYLAEQYAGNTAIKNLVDNREIYIIPCVNPDGWEYNRTVNGGVGGDQRKNRRNVGSDASGQKGVDLNRNWGVDWGNCGAPNLGPITSCGVGGTPTSNLSLETYYGSAAFSEPETQAIRTLVMSPGKNFVAGFDQHAYGPYYSLPYGRRSLHPGGLPLIDSLYLYNTSALMGQYNGMRANDSYGALAYEVAGGFKDWMLMGDIGTGSKIKAYGLTGEGSAGGGTSGNNFWAPAGQIINLCKGMCFQNLQLAFTAGSYVDIQDVSDISLTSISGNLDFSIRRLGLVNAPVTVSILPMQNIASVGTPVTIASLAVYNDTYSGAVSYTLPAAITNGQRVKFVWKVETGGQTYYDTVVKFYNPTQLLYDNMEGTLTTNWTNITEGTVASGFGYNYIAGDWTFTSSGGYGGSGKALSESAAGTNYTTRAIKIVQYNSTFNLSDASGAYLNFWLKHRAENFRDKMRVEVSTDGTNWTAIAGTTTVKEPGTLDGSTINGIPSFTGIRDYWTRQTFDLSAYNGTAALRLRFTFTSDNDASSFRGEMDDGFYIDNLKLIKSTVPLITLPVQFTSFTATLTRANTVSLEWKAETDNKHSHFVVERSTNGQTYSAIGTVRETPYQFIDPAPVTGNNYYRLKQYDVDGKFMYSTTLVINFDPSKSVVSLYPNPASDNVTVRVSTGRSERLTLLVSDLSGRIVHSQKISTGETGGSAINVQHWPSQTYIIKIVRDDNSIVAVQKLVKQN